MGKISMTPLPPFPTFNHEFVAPSGATDRPAAALFTPVGAAAGCPSRFVLDEERFLAALMSELELMPVFIREPSPEFLRATERGRA